MCADVISFSTRDKELFIRAFREAFRETELYKKKLKTIYKKLEKEGCWYYCLILFDEEYWTIVYLYMWYDPFSGDFYYDFSIID